MCRDHDEIEPLPSAVSRRGVIGGAIALAGAGLAALELPASAAGERSAGPLGSPPVPPPLVIENGTLLDPLTGRVVEDAVVVLDRGKVVVAGNRSQTRDAVAGVNGRVIDVEGRWVLPGLVDVHVHENAVADARAALVRGATTVRSGTSDFYQDVGLRALGPWSPGAVPRMKATGTFVTPNLGNTIIGDPALAPLAGGVRTVDELRYMTSVNLDRGVDWIKTRVNERAGVPEQDPLVQVYGYEQVRAIVTTARRRGVGVLCHSYSEKAIDDAVRAGIKSLEHGVFVGEQTLVRMARQGTYFTPTMSAINGLKNSPNLILRERGEQFFPVLQAAVRRAFELGVNVVAGTDSFGLDVDPIGGEVRLLHEAGLTALDAIRSATTGAARLLGLEQSVGRLARGYSADLITVNGSPLDNPAVLETPQLIIARGAVVTS
ncbi:amidohydrolase family protein [Kribbella shirazensis]|uniref:Imidazolonepropionase-like amidohydrolase n=1 Tax=Kribbella shirazensis TaxID=1105143 RepID=A0A7X6A1U5_9ACTN|nr:amidohydrolase family protein [Kribbella shirazensis]NIK58596.1 imidazolonepropionase-like amidohydrolase [Kribbella shirazensis]